MKSNNTLHKKVYILPDCHAIQNSLAFAQVLINILELTIKTM